MESVDDFLLGFLKKFPKSFWKKPEEFFKHHIYIRAQEFQKEVSYSVNEFFLTCMEAQKYIISAIDEALF